jgi:CRP-like cAMP-binding protein
VSGASRYNTEAALRNAKDERAAREVLSSLPDGGDAWLAWAETLLRSLLFDGELERARELGDALVSGWGARSGPRQSSAKVDAGFLESLLGGIRAVLAGEGQQQLAGVSAEILCNPSLRWAAWAWISASSCVEGALGRARTAADTTLTIAGQLDARTRAISQCVRGVVTLARGQAGQAQQRLLDAVSELDRLEDNRWFSLSCLVLSRCLFECGEEREALRAAQQAVDAAPDLLSPAIWLARRALCAAQVDEARHVLELLPPSPQVEREVRLVRSVCAGGVPLEPVLEYLFLSAGHVDEVAAEEVAALAREHRRLTALVEVIGWDLAAAGHTAHTERVAEILGADLTVGPFEKQPGCALMMILERGRREQRLAEFAPDGGRAALFWFRRAVASGRLEKAQAILETEEGGAEGAGEVERDRRLFESVRGGTVPAEVVAEYYWLRERPMTPMVAAQLSAFSKEHAGFLPLREVVAWDLASAGYSDHARTQFDSLAREEDLDPEAHQSIRAGLRTIERTAKTTPSGERRSVTHLLSSFVREHQAWPTVLDEHCLMFKGRVAQIDDRLLVCTERLRRTPGEAICRQGEAGALLTLCTSGVVEVSRDRGKLQRLGQIRSGSFFGEIGTIWGIPNTINAEAVEPTVLRVVSREQLLAQVNSGDRNAAALLKTLRSWYADVVLDINPIFGPLETETRKRIIGQSKMEIVQRGEPLAVEGEPSRLLTIVYGFAHVVAGADGEARSLGLLCPGDLVGELEVSPVTVTASTTVTVVPVARDRVAELSPVSAEHLEVRREACKHAVRC